MQIITPKAAQELCSLSIFLPLYPSMLTVFMFFDASPHLTSTNSILFYSHT